MDNKAKESKKDWLKNKKKSTEKSSDAYAKLSHFIIYGKTRTM